MSRGRTIPVWRKVDQLDHLAKLGEILTGILNFLQAVANGVGLVNHLEDCVAHRALVEQEIDGGHVEGLRGVDGACVGNNLEESSLENSQLTSFFFRRAIRSADLS